METYKHISKDGMILPAIYANITLVDERNSTPNFSGAEVGHQNFETNICEVS